MESPRILGTGHWVGIPELGQQKRTAGRIEAAAGFGVALAAERGVGLAGLRASQDTCDEGAEGKQAHRLRYCGSHIGGLWLSSMIATELWGGVAPRNNRNLEHNRHMAQFMSFLVRLFMVTICLTATWPALRTINIER